MFIVLVYTACGDGIARTYDAKSGALKREFKGHEKAIYAIQVNNAHSSLVCFFVVINRVDAFFQRPG